MKNINPRLIVLILALILLLVIVTSIFFKNITGKIDSPESHPVSSQDLYPDYINIAGQRYLGFRELNIYSIDSVPFISEYLNKYATNTISFEGVPVIFAMVNGQSFKTTKELVQKMALSNSPTVGYIDSSKYMINDIDLELNILTAPTGPKTYLLAGGFLDGDKGYFFQTYIGRGDEYDISIDDFQDIFEFNHPRNPKSIATFLAKIIEQMATSEWFAPFDDSLLNSETIVNRKKGGDTFTSEIDLK